MVNCLCVYMFELFEYSLALICYSPLFAIDLFIFYLFDKWALLYYSTAANYGLSNANVTFSLKFMVGISTLIFIRAGTPRYRYDYLSKLGWLKFLFFLLATLTCSVLTLMLL